MKWPKSIIFKNQNTICFLSLLVLFFLLINALSILMCYSSAWILPSASTSSLSAFSIGFVLLRQAPFHSKPDPGIEFDRKSRIWGGVYWGNLAFLSYGNKKAFFGSSTRYSIPTMEASKFLDILSSFGASTMRSICPLFKFLHLLFILDLILLAMGSMLKIIITINAIVILLNFCFI